MNMIERHEITEKVADIEQLVYRIKGIWTAVFNVHGENIRCQIDYCPWCGAALRGQTEHVCLAYTSRRGHK